MASSKHIICITWKNPQMHHFNLSHPTLTFQNGVFQNFFKVMQTVHLEGAMWDGVREILFIILPPTSNSLPIINESIYYRCLIFYGNLIQTCGYSQVIHYYPWWDEYGGHIFPQIIGIGIFNTHLLNGMGAGITISVPADTHDIICQKYLHLHIFMWKLTSSIFYFGQKIHTLLFLINL